MQFRFINNATFLLTKGADDFNSNTGPEKQIQMDYLQLHTPCDGYIYFPKYS